MSVPSNPIEIRIYSAEKLLTDTMIILSSLGLIFVILYSASIKEEMYFGFLSCLISIAANAVGFFIGILFGVPKRNDLTSADYTLNNSLVEISDWLTKIIVGLGLVNLRKIPGYLQSIGDYVQNNSNGNSKSLNVFIIAIILYFTVTGLYLGYNYMRLVLSQKYKEADDSILNKKLIEKEQEASNLKTVIKNKEQGAKQLVEGFRQFNESSKIESDNQKLIDKAKKKLQNGLIKNPNDPQKGQWGGKNISNGVQLNAVVNEIAEGAYSIDLMVKNVERSNSAMNDGDIVLFALHNSFGDKLFRIVEVKGGMANLVFPSYGSFTVGAFVKDENIELELDLAELPGVSEYFKKN